MGREIRIVAANWEHSKNDEGNYIPLFEGYSEAKEEFEEIHKEKGLQAAIDYLGRAPDKNDYMPDWSKDEATHIQMYENTSEGTPISPVMDNPEILARWLCENNASAFGEMTATYEQWLNTINQGYAPSAVIVNGVVKSGVEY